MVTQSSQETGRPFLILTDLLPGSGLLNNPQCPSMPPHPIDSFLIMVARFVIIDACFLTASYTVRDFHRGEISAVIAAVGAVLGTRRDASERLAGGRSG